MPQNYYDRLNEKGEISDPIYLRFRATFTTPPQVAYTLLSAGSEDITPLVLEHLEGSLPKEINPVRDMLLFFGQDKSIRVGLQFCLPLTRQITTTDADGRMLVSLRFPAKNATPSSADRSPLGGPLPPRGLRGISRYSRGRAGVLHQRRRTSFAVNARQYQGYREAAITGNRRRHLGQDGRPGPLRCLQCRAVTRVTRLGPNIRKS